MLDNRQEPSQQDIINRIKGLNVPEDSLEEQPEEPLEAVDVSDEDALSDELETEEVEELEAEEAEEEIQEYDDEESYFDIDGEEITLSQIKEWKDSGLRQSDYTRKTQDLADQRKALEAKSEQTDALINVLGDRIDELEGIIGGEEAEINWDELAEDDPSEYLRKQRKLDAKRAKLAEAKAQQKAKLKDKAAEESQLLFSKMPAWSDPEAQKKDIDSALKYAEKLGFTNDDLSNVTDHRFYMALIDASKAKAVEGKKVIAKKKVARAPKAIKAVKGKVKARPTALEEAKAKARKTGSKQDVLAALKELYNQ